MGSSTSVFDPGYVAAPVQAVPVSTAKSTGSAEDTSDSVVNIDQLKIVYDEANCLPRSDRVNVCDTVGQAGCGKTASFPFCSPPCSDFQTVEEVMVHSPELIARQLSVKDSLQVQVDQSTVGACHGNPRQLWH